MKKLLMLAAIFGMTYAATAQEKTDTAQPQSEAISQIRLANQLAKYGYENYSATALIEAARILSSVETQSLKSESFTPGEGSESEKDSAKPEFSPENLLASAKEFADGDETLLALANSVQISKSEDHRGLLGGPGRRVDRVAANSTDTYVLAFKYGVPAEIFVSGDGDTDLDLYVYDENGNAIVCDDDYSDDCYVCWTPAWTGNFVVKIVNRGPVYNQYVMLTN